MVQATRIGWWLIGGAAALIALLVFSARPLNPHRGVARLQAQIAQVRGLQFKRDVVVHEQSQDEFEKHARAQLQRLSAPEHEQVLRTLGLLASDETLGVDAVQQRIESLGPAGHYDPYSGRLLVVKAANPQQQAQAIDDMYARELYRALLDQHFDLKTYLERRQGGGALDNDELLARQIVVEGEASYAALLRRVKQKLGRVPDDLPLEKVFDSTFSADELIGLWDDPRVRNSMESPRKPNREPGSLPTYLAQLLKGMQQDGVMFADAVRERGWNEVEKLYTTSPPVSTEQILHPQKWFLRERPVTIQWPAFDASAAFADWELVEQNVVGELLLRVVFRAHRFSPMMGSAPAGWNGDRYAVFKRRGSGDMLLLLYTAWDTEADAAAFAEAYRVLVKEKHADVPKPVRILEEGRRVVIVEGGDESTLDAFMKFAQSAQEIQEVAAVEK